MSFVAEKVIIAMKSSSSQNSDLCFSCRLDKISKMESQQASGKLLNEEQLLLLSTKASVDRSLAELDPIRTQLEELAKEVLIYY